MLDGASILIVDADSTLRTCLARAMRVRGLEALIARDHVETLDMVATRRPDLLVLDLSAVPHVGMAIMALIHAIDPAIDILIWTIYGRVTRAVEALDSTRVHHLRKPADADDILGAFASATR